MAGNFGAAWGVLRVEQTDAEEAGGTADGRP
jgi:hypothetical protein